MTINFLRRDTTVGFEEIKEFLPLFNFQMDSERRQDGKDIQFAQIDWRVLDAMRGCLDTNIRPRTLAMDTIVDQTTRDLLVPRIQIGAYGVHLAHIFELLKMQPRGERDLPDGRPGPLVVNGRFGNMFIIGRLTGRGVLRLRYFDTVRPDGGHKNITRSGWALDLLFPDSSQFTQRGCRVGYYVA